MILTRCGHNCIQIILNASFTSHPITDAMQSQIRQWQSRKINHTHTQNFRSASLSSEKNTGLQDHRAVGVHLFVHSSLLSHERTNRQPRNFSWMLCHYRPSRPGTPTVGNNNATNAWWRVAIFILRPIMASATKRISLKINMQLLLREFVDYNNNMAVARNIN